ncbi:MAG: YfhO family protein [Oscillospiraceae bacterium]|nr:YfhO family protein [Oscillospiraceae bacterium]
MRRRKKTPNAQNKPGSPGNNLLGTPSSHPLGGSEDNLIANKGTVLMRVGLPALAFFIPFAVLVSVFYNLEFYPFGEKSLLIMDMNTQYIQFYDSLRFISGGENGVFFSWPKSMGTGFIGLFAYYLSSPLSFVMLLFRDSLLGIFYLTLIKISMCGLTSYFYLKYTFKIGGLWPLAFSTSYALMSYNLVYSLSPMWLDGVILLPLILLGAEKILRNGKPYVFIASLAVMMASHFYIGYMAVAFSFLFIVYRYVTVYWSRSTLLRVCGKFALYGIIGIGMSAWMLLPVFLDLQSGKLGNGYHSFAEGVNFPFAKYFTSFMPATYTGITNNSMEYSGLPALYGGLFVGVFCVIFFMLPGISIKKKLFTALLFALLLACFYFQEMDNIWHGFQKPVWFPFRYSFVFHFLSFFTASEGFRVLKGCCLSDKRKNHVRDLSSKTMILPIACILFVCCDLFVNSKAMIQGLDRDFSYVNASEYTEFRRVHLPIIDKVKENDNSFYRIEKTYIRTHNDSLSLGHKGITHYSSLYNGELNRFTKQLGFAQAHFWNSYVGSTPVTDSLFNVKYILSQREMPHKKISQSEAINDQELLQSLSQRRWPADWFPERDISVYENKLVLPPVFMVSDHNHIGTEGDNPFEIQNRMLSDFSGEEAAVFIPADNVERASDEFSYHFTSQHAFPLYIYFPANIHDGSDIYINGENRGVYFNGDNNHIWYIGTYQPGDEITLSFNTQIDSVGLRGEHIYYLDTGVLSGATEKLNAGALQDISHSPSGLKGHVDAKEDGHMFASIPYDKGWTVKVDGEIVETSALNGIFMLFAVPEGRHSVEMYYTPRRLSAGIVISLFSLIVFTLTCAHPYLDTLKKGLSRLKTIF